MTIALDTVLHRVQTVLESRVGEESLMMDVDKGMYYALNPVSSRIWALLEQPLSVQSVCEHLLEEYDVEPSICEQAVKKFLDQMLTRNIITVVLHETGAPSSARD